MEVSEEDRAIIEVIERLGEVDSNVSAQTVNSGRYGTAGNPAVT
ncbi:hypothetical protein [Kribbella antibiotica]|nr:hypothetical protein [Kribbella antibiotica]